MVTTTKPKSNRLQHVKGRYITCTNQCVNFQLFGCQAEHDHPIVDVFPTDVTEAESWCLYSIRAVCSEPEG